MNRNPNPTPLRTIPMKKGGKVSHYVEVKERIRFFREHEAYIGWSLTTEWIQLDEKVAIAKGIVKDYNGEVVAEGTCCEYRSEGPVNKTSYTENSETGSWGRALGNLGIGVDGSVAAADEIERAVAQQESMKKGLSTKEKFKKAVEAFSKYKVTEEEVLLFLEVFDVEEVNDKHLAKLRPILVAIGKGEKKKDDYFRTLIQNKSSNATSEVLGKIKAAPGAKK